MNILSLNLASALVTGILSVLAIIAIVVVAGYIIYLLSGLVIAIFDKKQKPSKFADESVKGVVYKKNLELDDAQKFVANDQVEMIEYNENNNINETEAEREKIMLKKSQGADVDWFKNDSENYHNLVSQERQKVLAEREAELAKQVEEIKNEDEVIDDINKKALKNSVEEDDFEDYLKNNQDDDIDARIAKLLADDDDEDDDEDDVEIRVVEDDDKEAIDSAIEENKTVEVDESMKEEIDELNNRIAELKQQLDSEKEANEKLAEVLKEKETAPEALPLTYDEVKLQEYEERLATLQEREKLNNKELKSNKKEFMPLYKIKKNLANDQEKLRRKEALVAKQKIVIFGVNNTANVDEEKAKKLEEEIDLLEGLRLSVEHCENVMSQNKDRYPILEKTNKILTDNANILKTDIEEVEKKIAEMKKLKK